MSNSTAHVVNIGLSGVGPRGTLYIATLAHYLLTQKETLKTLKDFVIKVTAFDLQDEDNIACGNAFRKDCDSATNTSVSSADEFGVTDPVLRSFINLRTSMNSELDPATYIPSAQSRNPAAAAMFKGVLDSEGKIDVARPCLIRGEWGRLSNKKFQEVLAYIKESIPQLQVTIHCLHEVIGSDFSNPNKPVLIVRKVGSDEPIRHTFDLVTLANGTPLRSPLPADIAPRGYSTTPNHATLRQFLLERGVLIDAATGKVQTPESYNGTQKLIFKPGAKIALTGQRLSAYDHVALLMSFLPNFQLTPDELVGYRIDQNGLDAYKGLITFISRSSRSPPPKHVLDWTWSADVSILSTEEMHSLRLQYEYNWVTTSEDFLKANVAYCVGKVPADIVRYRTAEERMHFYHHQNLKYLAAPTKREKGATEVGLIFGGRLAIADGSGFESNPKVADTELSAKAPYTRAGRFSWPFFRSSAYEMSRPEVANSAKAKAFMEPWTQLDYASIGSPVPTQHMITLLYKTGVGRHLTSLFKEIHPLGDGGKVVCGEEEFDALIAPRIITRDGDAVFTSLPPVMEFIPGQPKYGKGRNFITKDGQPINVFDFGLGGHGTRGDGTATGIQWGDTNSHGAVLQTVFIHAQATVMHCAAVASNLNPVNIVNKTYEDTLPSSSDFDKETAMFAPVWREVQEKYMFIQLAAELAGDDSIKYRTIMDHIHSHTNRESFIQQQSIDIIDTWTKQCQSIPSWKPATRDQYESRFTDYSQPQLDEMWKVLGSTIQANAKKTRGKSVLLFSKASRISGLLCQTLAAPAQSLIGHTIDSLKSRSKRKKLMM